MDLRKYTTVKLSKLIGILFLSLILVSNLAYSKSNSDDETSKKEKFTKNLLHGMESENVGLRESCIYMIGAYKIEEAGDELVTKAITTEDDKVLQLVAWSLYEIGNEEHCKQLEAVAKKTKSEKVKEIVSYLKEIKRLEKSVALD